MMSVAFFAVLSGLTDDDQSGDRHRDGTNACQGVPKALERFEIEHAAFYRRRSDPSDF